ncbi:RHS repeat-associated core domain-containing protein [Sorangium sp. So ce406]|uniref:RHS repeat-associated core domain-containing protein n=1 Tax=Sorangium sp. So ce406 TaxID=3133311 RepID=UPI003F5C1026
MNPGVFVMGGGGAGGGKGGKGGNGRGDGQGGDGQNGGNDAQGGGNGSGACGQGSTGSCTNCSNTFSAGDPVDVITGEVFTTPKTDLYLPGFFDLEIFRSYSTSQRERDTGLGLGWSFNIDWQFEVRRGAIEVQSGSGHGMTFPYLAKDGDQAAWGHWALLRVQDGFVLRPGNEFFHYFRPTRRGDYVLSRVAYRNRGHLSFQYEQGKLARIVDTAGRVILLRRGAAGRISSLLVPDLRGHARVFATYAYDAAGHLVEARDADGHAWHYAYDDEHRLTRLQLPTGLTFFYRYDEQGRCVETWGEYPGQVDPALADGLADTLADGRTRAKGILHCAMERDGNGYAEVVDSTRLQRFFAGPGGALARTVSGTGGVTSRTFDDHGRVTSHTDALQATTRWEYDDAGHVARETDAEGRTVEWKRDGEGRPVEVIDPAGGRIVMQRDPFGNLAWMTDQRGSTHQYRSNQRGLPVEYIAPNGGVTRFEYDGHGNLVAQTLPGGATIRTEYDFWGRRVRTIGANGEVTVFRTANSGLVTSVTDPSGRTRTYQYDGLKNIVAMTGPDGGTTRYVWGGLGWLCGIVHPDGTSTTRRYNREGWPLELRNERGELHTWAYNGAGQLTEERTFNGRTLRFGYDPMGRLAWVDEGDGKREILRNQVGQVIKDIAPDGSAREYEYDVRGELVAVRSPEVEMEWSLDAAGNVRGEALRFDGATYSVSSVRDASGARVAYETSLGHKVEVRRDAAGAVRELRAGGEPAVAFDRDAMGRVTARRLPEGGAIVDALDPLGRLRQRRVLGPGSQQEDPRAPWVGAPPKANVERLYEYTAVDEIAAVTSPEDGTVEFSYDVRRRLVSKRDAQGREERWAVDATSNYHESGPDAPVRAYESGDRIARRGDMEFVYDSQGFLIEKRRHVHGAVQRWRYTWGPWRMLTAVELPDGRRVEFTYDAFARRVAKRVVEQGKVSSVTHWVWDRLGPVHEIHRRPGAEEPQTVTYLYEDHDRDLPIAQRETTSPPGWTYYVGDINETPEDLVDGAGRRVGRMRRWTFGAAIPAQGSRASTPFRFPGQYADEETGLHYNRCRYYDPMTGRYISPDPIGVEGGLNLYQYGPNPIGWFDPMGWTHHLTVVEATLPPARRGGQRRPLPGMGQNYPSGYAGMPDYLRSQARAHSERRMLHDLQQIANSGQSLEGANVRVRGQYPPCPNCHRAMRAFAQQHNMNIQYDWEHPAGTTNSARYSGSSEPQFSGPQGERLRDAYRMRQDERSDNPAMVSGRREVNRETRPLGYVYEDSNAARQAYRDLTGEVGELE